MTSLHKTLRVAHARQHPTQVGCHGEKIRHAVIMRRACQLSERLSISYSGGSRIVCHATLGGGCTCAACAAPTSIDTSRSYQLGVDASAGVPVNRDACIGSRTCRCKGCRAETSGATLSPSTAVHPSAARQSDFDLPGIRDCIGLGRHGLLSSRAWAASALYSSRSRSRHRNSEVQHSRAYSTSDDYQSQVWLNLPAIPAGKLVYHPCLCLQFRVI